MAQGLRTLVAFADDPGSIPRIHKVTYNLIYNSTSRGSDAFSDQDRLGHQVHMWNTYIDAVKIIIHIRKCFLKIRNANLGL